MHRTAFRTVRLPCRSQPAYDGMAEDTVSIEAGAQNCAELMAPDCAWLGTDCEPQGRGRSYSFLTSRSPHSASTTSTLICCDRGGAHTITCVNMCSRLCSKALLPQECPKHHRHPCVLRRYLLHQFPQVVSQISWLDILSLQHSHKLLRASIPKILATNRSCVQLLQQAVRGHTVVW